MASHTYYYTNSSNYTDLVADSVGNERKIIYTQKSKTLTTTPGNFDLDEDNEATRGISRITKLTVSNQFIENIITNIYVQVGQGTNWFYIVAGVPVQRRDTLNIITSSNPIYFDGTSNVQLRAWVTYTNPHNKPLSPTAPKLDISFERIYNP